MARTPYRALAAALVVGLVGGLAAMAAFDHAELAAQTAGTELIRRDSQRELNAMSARLAELQAQATRLNAVGQRLVDASGLQGGEFNFSAPIGQGGGGPASDITPAQMRSGLDAVQAQFDSAGGQLTVLDTLLASRTAKGSLDRAIAPTANSYVTSTFGARADPFGAGEQFHKGIDFAARVGDPVYAVADGVVSFVGQRTGYGNVIEVDHGNGYVTRYAHNSQLLKQVGDLVRAGTEIAKAGSTGRSTGAHVHLEVWKNGAYVNPAPFLAGRSSVKRG
ncbi:MAG: M23 family metallopeptidase [Proteobacteria bacterium]|nr:M23 family metallopeptidase [Pseudomonadota bacterium]